MVTYLPISYSSCEKDLTVRTQEIASSDTEFDWRINKTYAAQK